MYTSQNELPYGLDLVIFYAIRWGLEKQFSCLNHFTPIKLILRSAAGTSVCLVWLKIWRWAYALWYLWSSWQRFIYASYVGCKRLIHRGCDCANQICTSGAKLFVSEMRYAVWVMESRVFNQKWFSPTTGNINNCFHSSLVTAEEWDISSCEGKCYSCQIWRFENTSVYFRLRTLVETPVFFSLMMVCLLMPTRQRLFGALDGYVLWP